MSIFRELGFNESARGRDRNASITLDLQDVVVDGVTKPCVVARVPGVPATAFPVDDAVESALNGKPSGSYGASLVVTTFLSAKEAAAQTALSVVDDAGFFDEDIVAIFNVIGDSPEYRLVSGSPAGNVITVSVGLDADKYKGAYVVRITGLAFLPTGRGFNFLPGALGMLEGPTPPTVAVVDGTGDTIDVTITANDEDAATHYDIYVRDATFSRIEPNWEPDAADQTDLSSAINCTTFEGGADNQPDGGGTTLSAATKYYVAVIAKTGAGRGQNESQMSSIVEFTLD